MLATTLLFIHSPAPTAVGVADLKGTSRICDSLTIVIFSTEDPFFYI